MEILDRLDLPTLDSDDLMPLLERARIERWSELALIGPGMEPGHRKTAWGRRWAVEALPSQALRAMNQLDSLVKLALPGFELDGSVLGSMIMGLPRLRSLDLEGNPLDDKVLGQLAELPSLASLYIGSCGLAVGSGKVVATYPALTTLWIGANDLSHADVEALAGIVGLEELWLYGCGVTDAGVEALSHLPELRSLNLYNNEVGDQGARVLARMNTLTQLWVHRNRIGRSGLEHLLDVWAERSADTEMLDLRIHHNPGAHGLDFLTTHMEDTPAMLAAWRRYRASTTERRLLNEAKLIVIGNEAVGKTSLIRFLTTGRPRDPDEKKTPGAEIERIETEAWHPAGSSVTLNVWDFGGQEIMHGTHRFFLTERSLYLLLLEARREDSGRTIYDWLKTIRNHGGQSPVLVIINKCDGGADNLGLDETAIQRDYPEVVSILRTSCNDDPPSRARVTALRRRIIEVIDSHPQLEHIRDPMPRVWLEIKDGLADKAQARKVLDFGEFAALCETGCGTETVDDLDEQRALMGLLNDLGVVVAHGWQRGSTRTAGITLLDPNWLTGAIYRLLNSQTVLDQQGELTWDQLPAVLDDVVLYPAERYRYIMDMMEHPDIAMCFELPSISAGSPRFLIPEALPPSEPPGGRRPTGDALHFRFHYAFLPPNLIPRFIVEAHAFMPTDAARWRTGVVLSVEGCQVRVSANRDTRVVDLTVTGPAPRRRSALCVARHMLDVVHVLNPEAEPEPRVPLPDALERSVSYKHLLKLERKYGPDHRFDPEDVEDDDRDYRVSDLLDGVRDEAGDARRESRLSSMSVHIGHLHGNVGALHQSGGRSHGVFASRVAMATKGPAHAGDVRHDTRVEVSITPEAPVSDVQAEQFRRDVTEILHVVVDRLQSLEAADVESRALLSGMLGQLAQLQALDVQGRTHGEVAEAVVQVATRPGEAPSATAARLGAFIDGVGASAAASGLLELLKLAAGG